MNKPYSAVAKALAFASVGFACCAYATPWADSDDTQMRHNLQVLADAGVVELSVSTYPLMWGALIEVLHEVDVSGLLEHELSAYTQVMAAVNFHRQGGYTGGKIGAQSNNNAERGFGQRQHEKAAVALTREFKNKHSALRLQTTWRIDREMRYGYPDKQELSLAGSYLATIVSSKALGSWVISVDQLYTWWSPSYDNDGMHTRSVQPLQSLRITRAGASPSALAGLSWLGPWSATAYVGRSERRIGLPELMNSAVLTTDADSADMTQALVPAEREEAFGIRMTVNPYPTLQLGARFTGSHLRRTAKNAAIDARLVLPSDLKIGSIDGQLAIYGELITHQSDIDNTYHTFGADYSFAFAGSNSRYLLSNARVFAEHLVHQQKDTILLGYSQFNNSGFGIDVRFRNIDYKNAYYSALYLSDDGRAPRVLSQALAPRTGSEYQRQQADISIYVPFRTGRLSLGLQAWQDESTRVAASASTSLSADSKYHTSDVNAFVTWEVRW